MERKLIILLAAVLLVGGSVSAQAPDSCRTVVPAGRSLAVFSGTVVSKKYEQPQGCYIRLKVEVDSVYSVNPGLDSSLAARVKEKSGKKRKKYLYVITSCNPDACYDDPCYLCGYDFTVGKRYIIYVCDTFFEDMRTSRCTLTRELQPLHKD